MKAIPEITVGLFNGILQYVWVNVWIVYFHLYLLTLSAATVIPAWFLRESVYG